MTARSCQDVAARPWSARSLQGAFYLQSQLPVEPRATLPSSVCAWPFRQEGKARSSGRALIFLLPVSSLPAIRPLGLTEQRMLLSLGGLSGAYWMKWQDLEVCLNILCRWSSSRKHPWLRDQPYCSTCTLSLGNCESRDVLARLLCHSPRF